MKRLIGFLVLGGAVTALVVRRLVVRRRSGPADEPAGDDRARTLDALRARLDRIPMPSASDGVSLPRS
jgi:hypothetical protein